MPKSYIDNILRFVHYKIFMRYQKYVYKKRSNHGGTLCHFYHLPYNVFPRHAFCEKVYLVAMPKSYIFHILRFVHYKIFMSYQKSYQGKSGLMMGVHYVTSLTSLTTSFRDMLFMGKCTMIICPKVISKTFCNLNITNLS
jgi:hypothetical protein